MSPEMDRIIDLWLGEVLGGRTPPDVLDRVRTRLAVQQRRVRRVRVLAACAGIVLAAGLILAIRSAPSESGRPAAGEPPLQQVQARLARIRAVGSSEGRPLANRLRQQKDADAAVQELAAMALAAPDTWPAVRAALEPLLGESPAVRDRALEIIARGPAPEGDPALLAALAERPSPIRMNLALLLAERELGEAVPLLGHLLVDERAGHDRVFAAAHFGLRGDARGVDLLRWFQDESGLAERSPSHLAAAAAARRVLGDRHAWTRAVLWARREVLSEDWPSQRSFLVEVVAAHLGYYASWRRGSQDAPPAQSDLRQHVAAFVRDGMPPLQSREDVVAYLDSLASGD